ncbi:efflux RND transporter periplasmic adaptor subunit [cf. Phormidesmis sp. LEGE 11477]|uniref:efflux RND transporter periplasmic adaptor subunit n=1 Tax=cf. Phormidesmis sp. LEGE 11477 TaxID=1828680 RepID=UPI001880915C|nr:HlyD family efflux transporter periplasmic adaptor subunit [cf. Phormidesmis sp. LEGE 11477]MBE9060772.1 HlyD family efflux transporter periplasmic adaptor subunit [cf. Phormidesmis sp. LEGE 11477]
MNATSSHSSTPDNSSARQLHSTQTDDWKRRWISLPAASWKLLLAVPLVLVPAIWLVNSTGDDNSVIETVQRLPVDTMRLRAADSYSTERVYSGELVARRSSELGFERGGTVTALLVDEGDVVSEGEPLARLDVRDLEAQRSQLEAQRRQVLAQLQELETGPRREDIASAEAAVSDLRNQLELAELQAQRRADLFAQGAVSAEELDERQFGANAIADRLQQAQSQLEELRNGTRQEQLSAQAAEVDQIDARIRAIDVSLDKSVLYAPFSGKVSQRLVDEGSVVGGSQQVMRLVENGAIEAKIGVPERVAQRLAVGESQTVQVGSRNYSAIVSAKLPEVDENSQTVTVVLEIAPDSDLTIGATATLAVSEQQASSGYWLPSTALVAGERGLWSVYVLTQTDEGADGDAYRVARRDVELLHSENDGETARSFVRGLVSEGDRIITSGTHRVVVDQLVVPSDISSNQATSNNRVISKEIISSEPISNEAAQ